MDAKRYEYRLMTTNLEGELDREFTAEMESVGVFDDWYRTVYQYRSLCQSISLSESHTSTGPDQQVTSTSSICGSLTGKEGTTLRTLVS
jgi:hypothetical protein